MRSEDISMYVFVDVVCSESNSNEIYDSLSSIDTRIQLVASTTKDVGDHIDVVLKHSEVLYEQSKELVASQSELQEGQVEMRRSLVDGMATLKDSYNIFGQEIDNLRNEAIELEKGITKLAEYGHRQQEELLRRQEQIQRVHDNLMENSKSILAAQESFESKQASMFIAVDKLFALHNAMLLESRLIKAFFVYCISIFIIYMFTSTKQIYKVKPWLYIGLCATFIIEVAILRLATDDNIEQKSWIINLVRSLFLLLASIQILHAICTYRDYEVLNHQMLLTLIEKINGMQRYKELAWDMDSDVNWSTWIDTDLPEDVSKFEDPGFIVPEEVGENSIMTTSNTRRYNLRSRQVH
ncbi:hypothetical protein SO802_018178 [Lithocarpus litseifolius]|uniref:Protein GAMETE EXPRESSED 1 n=1 Tax=Lithocarpus litseifolius TaxID=425828 RepID=A0AAW2CNG7_9ROSI